MEITLVGGKESLLEEYIQMVQLNRFVIVYLILSCQKVVVRGNVLAYFMPEVIVNHGKYAGSNKDVYKSRGIIPVGCDYYYAKRNNRTNIYP